MAEARISDNDNLMISAETDLLEYRDLSGDMAQAQHKEEGCNGVIPECAICLQNCVHPAQLPCGHVFCFLCVKGVANQSKKCAMCRQEIPSDFIEKPYLLQSSTTLTEHCAVFDDGYQWFYEGRNGWWQYDERTSRELEVAYKKGERHCELLIAGFLYIADFDAMLQLRRNDPSRRRRIKRDLATIPKKGVAGLRLEGSHTQDEPSEEQSGNTKNLTPHNDSQGSSGGTTTPIPPTNTPQTPASDNASGRTTPDRQESLHQAVEQIRSLRLQGYDGTSSNSSGEESGDERDIVPEVTSNSWALTSSTDEDL